ncbi:MAG: peptide MFS transporter [Parachlamydiaceae bacterium]|nr:peptide MFS transporter [Parachlamydiaceae bacterium]
MNSQNQPKALYLLNFVSMWECFSYYGMRVLLVLFMTQKLLFNDNQAFMLYALYTTLIEFGGIAGGVIADKYLGKKWSIYLGGWTIALGHICMAIPESEMAFFLGLGLIISGTCLFRTNVAAFISDFYEKNDSRLDSAYTIYYTGINLGGFIAAILCGIVGEVYGWHMGFGLASLGMLAGNVTLIVGRKWIQSQQIVNENLEIIPSIKMVFLGVAGLCALAPICAIALMHAKTAFYWFPALAIACIFYVYQQTKGCTQQEKMGFKKLSIYIIFLALFYAYEEQMGSTLILFAERHLNRETIFGIFPAASLVTFNPLTILIAGPLVARLFQKYPLSDFTKIQWGFFLLGSAFLVLFLCCLVINSSELIPLEFGSLSIVLISLGEILIGPTVFAAASKYAPEKLHGLAMGLVTLGFSLANLLSGVLSQMMAIPENSNSIEIYINGFGKLSLGAIVIGLFLSYLQKEKKMVNI